jgi:hypothetical protein
MRIKDAGPAEDGLINAEGVGASIAIARGDVACPVEALRAWLEATGIQQGAVFRPINKSGKVAPSRLSDRSVAHIVKAYSSERGSIQRSFPVTRYARGF